MYGHNESIGFSSRETTVTAWRLSYVVMMLAQYIFSMLFCSDHFLHCSSVVSLSCSNFCWSFLPHWQISGKSLVTVSIDFLFKVCQRQLKMNYLLFLLCILKCYWCLMKSREKILHHFFSWCNSLCFTEVFHLLTICPSVSLLLTEGAVALVQRSQVRWLSSHHGTSLHTVI